MGPDPRKDHAGCNLALLDTIAREGSAAERNPREDPSEGDFDLNLLDFCVHCGVGTPVATFPSTGAERFLDDSLDGPGTSPTFRAAPKTSVNLFG